MAKMEDITVRARIDWTAAQWATVLLVAGMALMFVGLGVAVALGERGKAETCSACLARNPVASCKELAACK